jgi:hypothetical protein
MALEYPNRPTEFPSGFKFNGFYYISELGIESFFYATSPNSRGPLKKQPYFEAPLTPLEAQNAQQLSRQELISLLNQDQIQLNPYEIGWIDTIEDVVRGETTETR